MEILTKSARETQKLGEKLAADLISGKLTLRVLCLYGDLGSGKTTFVQGLAKGLGIKKRILSPTFIMIRQYAISHMPYAGFYHIDLYRVEKPEDVRGLGLEEIFSNPENVVAIEWAEKIKKILPKRKVEVKFKYLDENRRKISLTSN